MAAVTRVLLPKSHSEVSRIEIVNHCPVGMIDPRNRLQLGMSPLPREPWLCAVAGACGGAPQRGGEVIETRKAHQHQAEVAQDGILVGQTLRKAASFSVVGGLAALTASPSVWL